MRDKPLIILSGDELLTYEFEPDNHLIDGMLWERDHIIILAREKVGKSILAMQMACALTSGEHFLGEYEVPYPVPVLYIQSEGRLQETCDRLKSMVSGVKFKPENFGLIFAPAVALDTITGMESLLQTIETKRFKPKVIFLDPLYMSMIGSLNDDMTSRQMTRAVRMLSEKYNAAIVIVHHEHKPKRADDGTVIEEGDTAISGSFVWKAFPDHVLHLRKKATGTRSLTCTTQRSSRVIENMEIVLKEKPLRYEIASTADHMPYVDTVFDVVKKNSGLCANGIMVATGLSIWSVKKALGYLSGSKVAKIRRLNERKRPVLYVSVDFKNDENHQKTNEIQSN